MFQGLNCLAKKIDVIYISDKMMQNKKMMQNFDIKSIVSNTGHVIDIVSVEEKIFIHNNTH